MQIRPVRMRSIVWVYGIGSHQNRPAEAVLLTPEYTNITFNMKKEDKTDTKTEYTLHT